MSGTCRLRQERGTALLLAIVISTILGVLASVIALTARMETLVAGGVEQGQALRYAADGALALAIADLGPADWTGVLAGVPSSFAVGDPGIAQAFPGLGTIRLCCGGDSLTVAVQRAANGGKNWGANTPQWRLYGWGPVAAWLPPGETRAPFYAAVWVADDAADGDGDPAADANGTIAVYAAAMGPGGGRRAVRAVLARPVDPLGKPRVRGVRIVAWHETQW